MPHTKNDIWLKAKCMECSLNRGDVGGVKLAHKVDTKSLNRVGVRVSSHPIFYAPVKGVLPKEW